MHGHMNINFIWRFWVTWFLLSWTHFKDHFSNTLSGILHSCMTTDLKYSHIYIINKFKTLYQMLELCQAEGDGILSVMNRET